MIDIQPHAPYGSKQARRAAKERAAQRMRDREVARQRAAGANQANFYACMYGAWSLVLWCDHVIMLWCDHVRVWSCDRV